MSVMENLSLRQFDQLPLARGRFVLDRRAMRPFAEDLIRRYGIRTASLFARLDTLSGGNIQRTVLARELSRDVRLLIMQNPCVGLDAAAVGRDAAGRVGWRGGVAAGVSAMCLRWLLLRLRLGGGADVGVGLLLFFS